MTFGADSAAKTGFQVQVKVSGMGWIDHSHVVEAAETAVDYVNNNDNIRIHKGVYGEKTVRIWDYAADAVHTPK